MVEQLVDRIEHYADLSPAIHEASGPVGASVLADFISGEDALRLYTSFVQINPLNKRPDSKINWHPDILGRPLEWTDILAEIRRQAKLNDAIVDPDFYFRQGGFKAYLKEGHEDWHPDGELEERFLSFVLSLSNSADFYWIDESGKEHQKEVKPGTLTIIRNGIFHKVSAPKQPSERLIAFVS